MNLFDLTEGKVKKQPVNEGIEIVYEKVVAEGDVVAFKRPVSQPKTNQQPQNYHAALELAGDWFWLEQGPMAHEMGTAKERKMQRLAAQKLVALKKLGYSVDWPLDDNDFYGVDLTYMPTKQTWRIDADNLSESMQGVAEGSHEDEWHAQDPKDEMYGVGDAYKRGVLDYRKFKQTNVKPTNPYSYTKQVRQADGWEKGFEDGKYKQDVAEDNQWHSDSSDQWHGQGGDAWHGATSDEWHGTGQGAGPATGMPAMKEADTAERLKRNLKKNGFDMDRFEAKIAEIERRNKELADEFYARHPELDDRVKDESATMFTSIGSDAGAGMSAATLGTDNDISPVGSGTVDEGYDNEVGFSVSSEQAYNAVMTKFGDYIEHRDDGVMYAPRKLWSAIEQTAFDADGVGAEEDSGLDVAEDQYGGGFGGGGIGPVTDSTSPVGGGGASVEEGLGAYDNDQGVKHTRGSLLAKLEALPKGSDDFEWNRQRAIQHLKQGNMVRAKYYMMLMKRGEQGVAEGLADTQQKIVDTINKLENRLKHAKTPEQWDRISARIERLQAGLNRSNQGVAEAKESDITEDIYESRLYKMKLAGFFE